MADSDAEERVRVFRTLTNKQQEAILLIAQYPAAFLNFLEYSISDLSAAHIDIQGAFDD